MNSILIIGAGFGQLPAIRKAKELGYAVICIDRNPNAVGMQLADFSYEIDVVDMEAALKIAEKHAVNGVMTMQSDLPVPTIGFVNEKLGLNGVNFEVAMDCSDKVATRKKLEKFNCEQPKFGIVNELDEALLIIDKIGYPCIIKAPDSSGSRGVVKADNEEDIPGAFKEAKKYSRSGSILIEEFIKGIEFGAQTFSINGKCEIVLMHNDTLSEPPYMIPVGHSFPFYMLNELQKEAAELDIKKAIESLGIKDGPANVDLILDEKSNKIKVIEVGARIGATCLPELVEYHTGIDWVGATILNATSNKIFLQKKFSKPVAATILTADKDGIFQEYSLMRNLPSNVVEFECTAKKGDVVSTLKKGTDRIGKVLAYGKNAIDAEKTTTDVANSVLFKID
ncbi:ATP-grasp domain-containing protein [Marinoscillum sp.]|uniref:ATP-grasp domain-containing protein n=1 Tax=Marinoscillum sp. TaxID=2024838 RepID=UPI003BA92148